MQFASCSALQVAATFLAPPLVGLAAFSSLHFLELLVGPKAAGLAIADPEELGEYRALQQLCYVIFNEPRCLRPATMHLPCCQVRSGLACWLRHVPVDSDMPPALMEGLRHSRSRITYSVYMQASIL